MRIALIGYGKMGKVIEKIALYRGNSISHKIDKSDSISLISIENTDIAIDFTSPESAFNNIKYCLENNIPVVSGSTGWLDKFDDIKNICSKNNGAFFYASNYSIGVNLFFKMNEMIAKLMNLQATYNVSMEEIHHTQKLDAPSGTAITLAEGIINQTNNKENWVCDTIAKSNELLITSKRIDKVPGTHTITYDSPVDSIEITHTAHNREGFALGAVLAAEWLKSRKGIFGMNDLLKL